MPASEDAHEEKNRYSRQEDETDFAVHTPETRRTHPLTHPRAHINTHTQRDTRTRKRHERLLCCARPSTPASMRTHTDITRSQASTHTRKHESAQGTHQLKNACTGAGTCACTCTGAGARTFRSALCGVCVCVGGREGERGTGTVEVSKWWDGKILRWEGSGGH